MRILLQFVRFTHRLAAERGDTMLEYVILAAIILAVVGMSVLAVIFAMAGRFDALAGSL